MNNEPRQDLAIYEGGDIQVKRPPELVLEEAMQAAEAWRDVSISTTRRGFMNPWVIRPLIKFMSKNV